MSRARPGGEEPATTAYVAPPGAPEEPAPTGSGHRPGPEPAAPPRTAPWGEATAPPGSGPGAEAAAPPRPAPRPDRIEGLLLGLAAGDAAGWPAARHRAARMPEWTRRLTRELDTFAEQNATTTLPVPIALNQPPEPLRLGPSDDAEWAAFAAEAVLRAGDDSALGDLSRERRMRAAIDLTWNAVASEVAAATERAPEAESAVLPLRARISVRAGLGNLATGLRPPATGHDNPHYFDDAACVRACVLAVAHPGDPRPAADLAEFDARYTQDGDGVHGARAMAAAVACALDGADVRTCVDAALAELPGETEIGRNARQALALAADAESTFALVPLLEHQIVDHVYSYGIAAAETVPVALALATAARGRIAEAVPAAACLSRVADSAPALAGALTGALGGGASIPASWRETCRTLPGCVLPRLTGTDLVELAGLLHATQPSRREGREEREGRKGQEGRHAT
ncbi:ADP-ribosylglycohydrolase family protein [Streptomyces sp. b94]|uniref:ADP-ribosylglycohydrolase family protein n=1 Tax=Streptomyces sp. b94 TaxID=1827634 RepID=UPI001B388BCF|nr:ADP-ribosylglycohydrolase family protein [Streptomyces sp. b94]MBQ1095765.1 ADP-ribosylglycohydrolase family protein [Streptomyces sp. b94]